MRLPRQAGLIRYCMTLVLATVTRTLLKGTLTGVGWVCTPGVATSCPCGVPRLTSSRCSTPWSRRTGLTATHAPSSWSSPPTTLRYSYSFSFSSRWHRSAWKGPYALRPVSHQSPQGCPRNSANICLVEHRSFSTLEVGMSAASFLHSSLLQAINAVMLWPVHVEKVPQASEHLCSDSFKTELLTIRYSASTKVMPIEKSDPVPHQCTFWCAHNNQN